MTRGIRRRTLGIAIAVTVIAMIVPFSQAFFHVELSYNEGWNIYNAAAVANHQVLYPERFGWTSNNYPMLSFVLFAQLHRVTHDYLFTARVVSLLSLLAAAWLAGAIVRELGGTRLAGWLGGLFCLAIFCCDTTNYVGADDPQLLAQAVFLAGLLVYLKRRESLPGIAIAALIFVLGGSIKHNPIDVPLAVLIDLAIVSWRRALWFSMCGIAFAAVSVGLQIHFGGPFFLAQLLTPRVYVEGKVFGQFLNVFGPLLVPFVLAILAAFVLRNDPRRRIATIFFVVSLVVGGYFGGGKGVSINCLFSAMVATSIVLGLFCSELELGERHRWSWVPAGLFVWLIIPLMVFGGWNPIGVLRATARAQQQFQREVALLKAHPGPALCESLLRCELAGKPYSYDPFNATRLIELHKLDERVLIDRIEHHAYTVIELEKPAPLEQRDRSERFAPEILAAIQANYTQVEENSGTALYLPGVALRAFSLSLGIPGMECSGVFIGENAHQSRGPALHQQGKCSSLR